MKKYLDNSFILIIFVSYLNNNKIEYKMEYKIEFDKRNSNVINFYKNEKLYYFLVCPPIEKGCDILNINSKIDGGYLYDFKGMILTTTVEDRKLYYNGDLIAETKRGI